MVFPVTFIMPDGSSITVESDDESGWSELKSWYESNDAYDSRPNIQYPVDIVFDSEEGEINETINNDEDMNLAIEQCKEALYEERDRIEKACYDLVFPVTFIMPDGSSITVESDDESGWSELKLWYESNESEEEPGLQYPVEIVRYTEQGEETIVINSEEELAEVKETCRDYIEDSDDSEDCFEYLFPVTFVMPDGSTITIENEDGLLILRRWYEENSGYEEEPVLQYPVSVVLENEEGETTLVVNSETEIDMIYEECELDE